MVIKAHRAPSKASARVSMSWSISVLSPDLRRLPSRGPNHIPPVRPAFLRLIHLPSVQEWNSSSSNLSIDDPPAGDSLISIKYDGRKTWFGIYWKLIRFSDIVQDLVIICPNKLDEWLESIRINLHKIENNVIWGDFSRFQFHSQGGRKYIIGIYSTTRKGHSN